ncbi:MAG: hypothetical protein ACRDYZ_01795 [Acidimicrobiales bacterium]
MEIAEGGRPRRRSLGPTTARPGAFRPTGSASQTLGRLAWGRSLDDTLRMVQVAPAEWVLCDIRMHAVVGGYGQGIAYLWSESGTLLATASQSISIRFWDDGPPPGRARAGA